MLQQAIGLSIILSFLSTELLGLLTGGLVSAGYLAFYVEQPWRIASTVVLALVVYGLTMLLGRCIILYGRRRFMLTVILGLLLAGCMSNSRITSAASRRTCASSATSSPACWPTTCASRAYGARS